MVDVTTNQPLKVLNGGETGPYLRVPEVQLDDLQRLLDGHGIRYWVHDNRLSYNGSPYMATVNFGRGGDARTIQAVLDAS